MRISHLMIVPVLLAWSAAAQPAGVEYRLRAWQVGGEAKSLPAGPAITIQFLADGLVGGSAGVNRYVGAAKVEADGAITWKRPHFAATMMAGPDEAMRLEDEYLKTLPAMTRLELQEGQLLLSNPASGVVLVYSPAAAATLQDVFASEYTLTRFEQNGVEVGLPQTEVTLALRRDGRLAGSAAVNRYFGGFRLLAEHEIAVNPGVGSTRRAGPPEWMRFDDQYLRALPMVQKISAAGESLVLEGPGLRLEFRSGKALE
jgi:heat shock protein HslJ